MKTTFSMTLALSLALFALPDLTLARSVPDNVRAFYERVKPGKCAKELKGGFYSEEGGPRTFSYCQASISNFHVAKSSPYTSNGSPRRPQRYLAQSNSEVKNSRAYRHRLLSSFSSSSKTVVYLHSSSDGGQFPNMDVDCDGDSSHGAGRCSNSKDTQSQTAFQSTVASYRATRSGQIVNDLDANVHPYVVFGNDGTKPGYTTFDPSKYGIEPLSVMAVVCGDKLIYGIWGDTNGMDGVPLVGETSISLATACYGSTIDGDNGHDADDVLYLAFPGKHAVPGKTGAAWGASTYTEFAASIRALGDELVACL